MSPNELRPPAIVVVFRGPRTCLKAWPAGVAGIEKAINANRCDQGIILMNFLILPGFHLILCKTKKVPARWTHRGHGANISLVTSSLDQSALDLSWGRAVYAWLSGRP